MAVLQFSKRVLFCIALTSCLAAASPADGEDATSQAASDWLDTLRNLPVVRWFVPTIPAVPVEIPKSTCRVEPLPPIDDPEALLFERDAAPDSGGLVPAMARALEKFQQLVISAGGRFELKSAYRPPAYQAHLQQVWFKWMLELRNNHQPGCQALRAEVGEEFTRHRLLETQKPVTSSDHTRGLAFDATVLLPRVAVLKKRRVSLDRLALLAGITRPDVRHDPVHFKLVLSRTTAISTE